MSKSLPYVYGWFRPSLQLWRRPLIRSCPTSTAATAPEPASSEGDAVAAVTTSGVTSSTSEGPVVVKKEWRKASRRTGLIAVKLGMTQLWNKEGQPIAVTVLQVSHSLYSPTSSLSPPSFPLMLPSLPISPTLHSHTPSKSSLLYSTLPPFFCCDSNSSPHRLWTTKWL